MKNFENKAEVEKAILFGVQFASEKRQDEFFDGKQSLNELKRLAETAGIETLGMCFQNAKEPTAATLIGSGKVEEIKLLVENSLANLVICDQELSGSQVKNLQDIIGVKVVDRTTLILDIFAQRAKTNEGKLQVELAQLKYFMPRISSISGTSGRYGSGGVGTRGPGETKLELDKRFIRDKILKLEKEIENLKKQRNLRRQNRENNYVKKVSIVGYTNAGKSTLMNRITKAGIYADDKLFATLDTTSRKLFLEPGKQIVLTDTVGFINKLPHAFVEAFSATLEEVKFSDLILVVFDSDDPHLEMQKKVVFDELEKQGTQNIPKIVVYNKIDKLNEFGENKNNVVNFPNGAIVENALPKRQCNKNAENVVYISAIKDVGIERLKQEIIKKLF